MRNFCEGDALGDIWMRGKENLPKEDLFQRVLTRGKGCSVYGVYIGDNRAKERKDGENCKELLEKIDQTLYCGSLAIPGQVLGVGVPKRANIFRS